MAVNGFQAASGRLGRRASQRSPKRTRHTKLFRPRSGWAGQAAAKGRPIAAAQGSGIGHSIKSLNVTPRQPYAPPPAASSRLPGHSGQVLPAGGSLAAAWPAHPRS